MLSEAQRKPVRMTAQEYADWCRTGEAMILTVWPGNEFGLVIDLSPYAGRRALQGGNAASIINPKDTTKRY